MAALRAGRGPVALTGIGGAGKSTLAAGACGDRRVRRRFRDGVTWLEADPGQDPVTLLGDLARRLGLPESESGFTTVAQGRDKIAAVLRGKRMLVAVDNVWERGPLDALAGLAPGCTVMFTTRLPELATTFGATQITVDELTQDQALAAAGPLDRPGARGAAARRPGAVHPGGEPGTGRGDGRGDGRPGPVLHRRGGPDRTGPDPGTCRSGPGIPVPEPAGGHRGRHLRSAREPTSKGTRSWRCSPGAVPFPARPPGSCGGTELAEAEVGDLLAELDWPVPAHRRGRWLVRSPRPAVRRAQAPARPCWAGRGACPAAGRLP